MSNQIQFPTNEGTSKSVPAPPLGKKRPEKHCFVSCTWTLQLSIRPIRHMYCSKMRPSTAQRYAAGRFTDRSTPGGINVPSHMGNKLIFCLTTKRNTSGESCLIMPRLEDTSACLHRKATKVAHLRDKMMFLKWSEVTHTVNLPSRSGEKTTSVETFAQFAGKEKMYMFFFVTWQHHTWRRLSFTAVYLTC